MAGISGFSIAMMAALFIGLVLCAVMTIYTRKVPQRDAADDFEGAEKIAMVVSTLLGWR